MRIVCWQMVLMKYHTFFSKNKKDVAKIVVAVVVLGILRVNSVILISMEMNKTYPF